jgi:hypothetical protein
LSWTQNGFERFEIKKEIIFVTSKMNWTLGAILLAASYVGSAPSARAQQPSLGTFTLPVAAHFGSVVLQPGEYTISAITGTSMIRVAGEGGIATILAASIDTQAGREHGRITLANVNGTLALQRFDSGVTGKRFDFDVAKLPGKDSERLSASQRSAFEIAVK